MDETASNAAAAVAGALGAAMTDASLRRARRRTALSAMVLVGAAMVYPLARTSRRSDPDAERRENASVGAALAVAVAALTLPERAARSTVAAGWLLHAAFDQLHKGSPGTRLPRWYPALCAGYDVAMAAALGRR